MALRDLTSETMTVISRDWLDPAKERPILASLRRVAPLLPDLEQAHRDLLEFQQPAPRVSPEMAALTQRVTELDAQHDRLARGIHTVIAGLIDLTEDTDQADDWRAAQAELFPEGKSITKRSYIDQAGEASRVEARLSDRSRVLLDRLRLGDRSLLDGVRRWQQAAHELGEAEKERILLAKEDQPKPSVGKVRNTWIGVVNTILAMLDREVDLSEADRFKVLEPLETALAKAAARKRSASVVEAKGAEPEAETG